MKRVGKIAGWVVLALMLIAAYPVYRIGFGRPFTINQLADRQALAYLVRSPELFTQIGLVDGTFLDGHSGRLSEVGVKKRDADYALVERFEKEVRAFDRATLSTQDQITYDILMDQWETVRMMKRFDWLSSEGLYPIAPQWGTQEQLISFLQSSHVVKNPLTARNYVKRLKAMPAKLDAVTGEMQRQARMGVVLPLALLEKAEQGIKDTIAPQPGVHPLVTSFRERMARASIDSRLQDQLTAEAATELAQGVYPAYQRMIAALEGQRAAAAGQAAGVSRLPEGAAYYAAVLKQMTTTDYTPDQVHALGLQEVGRITGEMDALLKAQGLSQGTVGERMQALSKDPRYLQPNTDAGRQQLLARYQQILDEVAARIPQYFRTMPAGRLEVKRVPLSTERTSAGAYYEPAAMDGSRAGTFFVNLKDTGEHASWQLKTLAYHEGIPGHHLQIATAMGLKGQPMIRQQTLYSAYAEGWALYAEHLAAEMGMYKEDPLGDLGRLQAEIFRSVRLVVDTGIHAKGWSREQAITYMVANTGMAEREVISEIERYMGQPGQACAYKVGELKILALRDRAKAALGARFDLRDFHTVVLENGGVPLNLLEKLVDEWIASLQKQGATRGTGAGVVRSAVTVAG